MVSNEASIESRSGRQTGRRCSTERTQRLADDAASRVFRPFSELAALYNAYPVDPSLTPMLGEALQFASVFPRLTPVVREGELIVGAFMRAEDGDTWGWYPDGMPEYIDGFARNAPEDNPDLRAQAARGLVSPQGSLNHKVVDYAGFVRTGSLEMERRAQAVAETRDGAERDFCIAFATGHRTLIKLAQNYATACERLALAAEPARAAELLEIARICRNVPANPAKTFHEAIQSFWFAYLAAGDGIGRPDVFLNEFYERDIAAGRITPDRALELVECLLIKLHGDCMDGDVNVSSIQTMTLGGTLADGSDACNELTSMFLTAARNVRLLRPTIYVRCTETTPDDVLELAATMLGEGLAQPSFYGDRPIIEGLTRVGIPLDEARDYALSGCTEIVSPGLGAWGAPNGWIDLALMVDDALRECDRTGQSDPEGIWHVVEQHVDAVAEYCRLANAYVDEAVSEGDVRFWQTVMMPVTLDRCKDIVHGGARSYVGHWEGIGLPNAADMLYAAFELIRDGTETLDSVYRSVDADDETLLAKLRALPKFGNDCEAVDGLAARLVDAMAGALESRSTRLRSALVLGHLAGAENMHVAYGIRMGATLDGRRAGQPLADSLAGSQGKTVAGPTAVIRSLCRIDHSRLIAGNVSTLRLSPSDFATPEGRKSVVSLVRAFVQLGGSQLQINVADARTLREAQEHPDEYQDLLVRVAGYSARFTGLSRRLQDEIIARTETLAS